MPFIIQCFAYDSRHNMACGIPKDRFQIRIMPDHARSFRFNGTTISYYYSQNQKVKICVDEEDIKINSWMMDGSCIGTGIDGNCIQIKLLKILGRLI